MWSKTREALINWRDNQNPSFPRTRESISLFNPSWKWIPAFAGMTIDQRIPSTVIGGVPCRA